MRIAIAGSGQLAASMLFPLLDSTHEVVAVLLDGRQVKGYKRAVSPLSDALLGVKGGLAFQAARHGLPIVWLDTMDEENLDALRKLQPDIVMVGGFSIIFKKSILSLPGMGCVNMHSSLLPKHRGPNPFCAVILAGEPESGVTFHIMDETIDTGDILEQGAFPLSPDDTPYSIHAKACAMAASLVVPVMDRIEREGLKGVPQNPAFATYDKKPTKTDAWIRWDTSVDAIDRQLRALSAIHPPWFSYQDKAIQVTQAELNAEADPVMPGVVLANKPHVRVAARDGSVTILSARTTGAISWPWPQPWNRPYVGESLLPGG